MSLILLPVLLLLSGLVSASETAVFSLQAGERRRLSARHAAVGLALARPTSLLVTLLLANLAVNIAYMSVSARLSLDYAAAGRQGASIAMAGGSLLALIVFGEILPKSVALSAPRSVAVFIAPLLVVLRIGLRPAVVVAEAATRLVGAALFRRLPPTRRVAVDDFKSALSWRAGMGTYHAVELALLHDVVEFGVRRARDVMVPRVDVVFLDLGETREQWIARMAAAPHVEYPVCDGEPDRLLGTLNAARLLLDPRTPRRDLLVPALCVPAAMRADRLVDAMLEGDHHLAIVLDEYGGVAGVVGLRALMAEMLGEIEGAPAGAIESRPGGALLVRGECPVHELRDERDVRLPSRRATTVSGALAEAVGRLPRSGDELLLPTWRVRVVSMRGRRVDRVLIRPRGGRGAAE